MTATEERVSETAGGFLRDLETTEILIRVSSIQVRAVAGSRKSTRIGTSASVSLVMSHPFYRTARRFSAEA